MRGFGGEMGRDRETEPKTTHRVGVATHHVISNRHAKMERRFRPGDLRVMANRSRPLLVFVRWRASSQHSDRVAQLGGVLPTYLH
jgi:hypothetical protein